MKILVLTPTFLPIIGGAEVGIFEIYQRLVSRHQVNILTPNIEDKIVNLYKAEDDYFGNFNFAVHRFNDYLNKCPSVFKKLVYPFSISFVHLLYKYIKKVKPDIVNVHYAIPTGFAGVIAKKLTRMPVVLSLVGRDIPTPTTPVYWKKYIKFICNNVSEVIYISEFARESVYGKGSETKPGHIIPYGVDIHRFNPQINVFELRGKLGIRKDARILFALQRLDRIKRVDLLIEGFKKIQQVKKDVVLIIGGKGREENALKVLAKKLNIQANVIFNGYIPETEIPQYFALADIFAFHSTYETFGVVLAQAMASGKPIVSVKSSAIPEVVDNGLNGLLVEPLNSEEFAAAILKLLDNKGLCEKLSQNAREKAVSEYSWTSIALRYEKVFERLISSNN